jgi:hypothetical protein
MQPNTPSRSPKTGWRANGASVLGVIFLLLTGPLLLWVVYASATKPPPTSSLNLLYEGGLAAATVVGLFILSLDLFRLGYSRPRLKGWGQWSERVFGWVLLRAGIVVLAYHLYGLLAVTRVRNLQESTQVHEAILRIELSGMIGAAAAALVLLVLPGWLFGRHARKLAARNSIRARGALPASRPKQPLPLPPTGRSGL